MQNTLFILALTAAATLAPAQQEDAADRGIQLKKQPGNVTYDIELTRGTQHTVVPPDYRFKNGDRFVLRVRVAADSYVYVLNRTFVGSPDQLRSSRQIRLVTAGGAEVAAPEGAQPSYTLIYPPTGNHLVKAGQVNAIPGSELALEMDENPGLEHLVLVVSPKPLDVARMFASAVLKPGSAPGPQQDTSTAVYAKLRQDLVQMAHNATVDEARSIELVDNVVPAPIPAPAPAEALPAKHQTPAPTPQAPPAVASPRTSDPVAHSKTRIGTHASVVSVAAPKVVKEPFLVEIMLAHYPA